MALGPVQYLVVKFEGNNFKGEILDALSKVHDSGTIRVIDLLFVKKNSDGTLDVVELDDLADAGGFDQLVNDTMTLLSEAEMLTLADDLEPDTAEAVLVFEHVWATEFVNALRSAGGTLVDTGFVPHDVVEDAEAYYLETTES